MRRASGRSFQHVMNLASSDLITFARGSLEAGAVKYGHGPSSVFDHPLLLEGSCHKTDLGPVHTKHICDELLGEIELVSPDPVMGHEYPTSKAFVDIVEAVASDRLRYEGQVHPEKAPRRAEQRAFIAYRAPKIGNRHRHRITGNLANCRFCPRTSVEQHIDAVKTLTTNRANFNDHAVLHVSQHRKDGSAGKDDRLGGLATGREDGLGGTRNRFELTFDGSKIGIAEES